MWKEHYVQRRDRQQVMWPSNYHELPGNLRATWDASYQPPLWVDTSAAWIFNTVADLVADYWWIINPFRLELEELVWCAPVCRRDEHFHRTRYVSLLALWSELFDLWKLFWIMNEFRQVKTTLVFCVMVADSSYKFLWLTLHLGWDYLCWLCPTNAQFVFKI